MKLEKEALQSHMIWHTLCVALCWMTFVASDAAHAQGGVNEVEEIHGVLRQASAATEGMREDCNLLTEIARTQAKVDDVELAVQTAAAIRDDGCSQYAFEQVNAVLGDVQKALRIS